MRITFLLILFQLFTQFSLGQNYHTRNISMNDGLPSNTIRDIYKDSRGYIWIGTEAGLVKFDGTEFKTYTTRDGLSGNRIWSITEDTLGNLWIANYGNGISMFDGKEFTNYSTKDGLVNDNVRIIKYSEKHKGLLIGTVSGFSFYKDSTFISFRDSAYLELLQVTSFIETDSIIYLLTFGATDKFIVFNPKTKSFNYLKKDHRYHKIHTRTTISYINQKKDTLIGCYTDGIKIYTSDSLIYNDKVGQIFDIVEDKYKNLWLASWTNYGSGIRNDKGGIYKLTNYKEEYYNEKLDIVSEQCWCLYLDTLENILWIGTIDKGIYIFPMDGFSYTKAEELNPDLPEINDLFIDSENNIWKTAGDRILKNYKLYPALSRENITKQLVSNHALVDTSWKIKEFYRINEDIHGNIWINSNVGYFSFNKNLTQLDYVYFGKENFEFFFTDKKSISILTFNYILQFTNIPKKVINYLYFRKNTTFSSLGKYKNIDENFWIINDTEGISLYNKDSLVFFPYLKDQINLNFNAICSDNKNNIIVGTLSGEIYILKYTNDSLIVDKEIQLEDYYGNKINWLITDKENNLFIGTNKGLVVTDLGQNIIELKFFDKYDGFFDYNGFKSVLDSSGNILVISNDNITTINKKFIQQANSTHQLIIKDIQVNNQSFNWAEINKTDKWSGLPISKIKLKHTQNSLIFFFDFLQYQNPNNDFFSYKLEGSSMDWTPFTKDNKAVFSYLKHGKYTFKVQGYNLSNPTNIIETEFNFRILPPWYKTWWFYSISILITLTILFLIYKYRIKTIKEKAQIQQKISELKLDALKAQMNPHFIFNAFNSLQKYILNHETDNALNYLSDFANLIRKTLDNSSKKEVSLSDEIEYLKAYLELEKLRLENLNYTVEIDEKIDDDYTYLPPMLIQPFVENAILHGIRHLNKKGYIKIRFEEESNSLKVIIEDNGIGRLKSSEINKKNNILHESKGTNITQQRLSMLSNNSDKIKVEIQDLNDNNIPSGTKVILNIPIS